MEKINFRFLNYKKYDTFTRDLSQGKVREDAIVFIQDKLRIWARGKEYICDEKNRVTIDGEDIILTDKDGNQETFQFTTKDDFEAFSNTVNQQIERLKDRDQYLAGEIQKKQDTMTIDSSVDINSLNVVENHAIASALENKIDLIQLTQILLDYITENDLLVELNKKQNTLHSGYGINIENDTIEVTLDDDVFVIVDDLPTEGISTGKIYLKEQQSGGTTKYFAYRYDGTDWIPLGEKTPNVDLTEYLKTRNAQDLFQEKGTYLTPSDLITIYSKIAEDYQKKGDYAQVGYVNQKLEWLQRIIDDKYVLKQDVYYIPEGGWSSSDIVSPGDTTVIDNGSGSNHGSANRMVTLTIQAYERLVEINGVNPDTYYFTYEGEDEAEGWVFGDTFPVIFSDKTTWQFGDKFPVTFTDKTTWEFGDKFPVILTNGTAEGLGEFPINLT